MKSFRPVLVVVFCICFYGGARLYYNLTDDFRPSNFISHLKGESFKEPDLDPILGQKFTYLGKGAQSYALESADGKYILKLFKNKHLKPNKAVQACAKLPFLRSYCEEHIAKKERKLQTVLNGYETAYKLHGEESGLIFVHLNETEGLNVPIQVEDKLGRNWELELNPVAFVIQEKGVKLRTLLHQLLNNAEIELAKKRIDQVLDLYLAEYEKGIYDLDWGVMHNFGFVGEKPIHFDVGKLHRDPAISKPENFKGDLEKVVWKISAWLNKAHPQYKREIISEIEEKLTHVLGGKFQTPQVMI